MMMIMFDHVLNTRRRLLVLTSVMMVMIIMMQLMMVQLIGHHRVRVYAALLTRVDDDRRCRMAEMVKHVKNL